MKVTGKSGAEFAQDEGLRKLAVQLINDYPDELGHIDPQRVVFLRSWDNKAKWFGKTWFINAPHTILPWYAYAQLAKNQLVVPDLETDEKTKEFLDSLMNVSYIICLNNSAFVKFESDEELMAKQVRNVLIHELMHIPPVMEGIRKHDVEDFADLLRKFGVDWAQGVYDNDETMMES